MISKAYKLPKKLRQKKIINKRFKNSKKKKNFKISFQKEDSVAHLET